jgi:alginate O-acetyltransferase complex protein AlgI
MSLSRWFRDYLYIPLGGNRNGLMRTCLNILIVFTLCGLWHGASWTFIVWGALHGVFMVAERLAGKFTKIQIPNPVKIAYAFSAVSISWIFFRSQNLADALYILRYAFVGYKNFILPRYVWASISQIFVTNKVEMIITAGLLVIAILLEFIPRANLTQWMNKQPIALRFALYILLVLTIIHLRNANIKQFIYVRF